ncbi:MAG: menaquinone biosynthesis family protein [Nitrospirota bacterium]|jgi:1,4-dihydroxy-6-naphthoate synthase|nr:1,4-dihydroxy-6-naphthoate synthase [Nitrospirota bacterium]
MIKTLTIGYSPCPNDTFIFYALTHGKVRVPGIEFREQLEDVETLNRMALDGGLDITKISYHALGHLRENYALLRSGGALGRGCGPLIVARAGTTLGDLKEGSVAIPGKLTTAYLLLRLFDPSIENITVMTFDRIMDAVSKGNALAGLIIHESRFTYPLYNLKKMLDLGEWWERYSGLPIPLGGILGKRSLGRDLLLRVEEGIRESLRYASAHPDEVMSYCRRFSQEMDEKVMRSHIDLYVNAFSLDLAWEGLLAVRRLFAEAEARGIFPSSDKPLLAEEV